MFYRTDEQEEKIKANRKRKRDEEVDSSKRRRHLGGERNLSFLQLGFASKLHVYKLKLLFLCSFFSFTIESLDFFSSVKHLKSSEVCGKLACCYLKFVFI